MDIKCEHAFQGAGVWGRKNGSIKINWSEAGFHPLLVLDTPTQSPYVWLKIKVIGNESKG